MSARLARAAGAASLALVAALAAHGAERWDLGLAPGGATIEAVAVEAAAESAPTVLIVSGLTGSAAEARLVDGEVFAYRQRPIGERPFRLLAVALANPEASTLAFPPAGKAFRDNPESHALWRWIAIEAPDLVLVAGEQDYGLASALAREPVAGVGRVPAERVATAAGVVDAAQRRGTIARSDARREIERRLGRSPRAVADELARFYGHSFEQLTYIPGLSLTARIKLGAARDVAAIVAPWVDGEKAGKPEERPVSRNYSGYLVFAELAQATGDARYVQMVREAANAGFTASGEMKESMGTTNGMSDGVFMGMPILGRAAALTGETKYCTMAARHLKVMENIGLRADGLYRHSPQSSDVAWGRGNAFPALGMALTLSDCGADRASFEAILGSFRNLLAALAPYQDENGMWREVIDVRGAYPEYTATAMIGIAMARGVRAGWLDAAVYQPKIDAAWRAILKRTGSDGVLMNVCESTNFQATLQDYLWREAYLGYDPNDLTSQRGGGMAMLFATELAGLP